MTGRRVLVVTHSGRPEAVTAEEEAVAALEAAGFEPVLAGDDMPGMSFHDIELAIILGGDGTILRAAELARAAGVPLLGINLGHVGFLAESERDDIGDAVRRVAAGDYAVEERTTLQVQVQLPGARDPIVGWALNEAALEKAEPAKMVEVVIEVDDRPLSSFGCDGVVLATSTGSTAHAFSAGGPVVWPEVDSMIVVPLSAHALFARPLVVGPRSVVAVEVLTRSPSPAVLVCDGRRRIEVPAGSRVEVRRSPVPVRLARLTPAPFTDRLVKKFDLPVVGWRGRSPELDGMRSRRGSATTPE
ncbi:NAD kinase [Cellulomonas denverensis]|uniref:NAD kinase n=1 Tax=Cellulomonas denverensis TaxID=264297 RepID=A0A7X6KU56_9CELL|nr:NAD kinase [Cellulomonas denverensis]NKY22371.1 NAD kinase [Cellulomonas denverensis]GIG25800.1 NAD kinase 2 [Cellulomonas denverensis]